MTSKEIETVCTNFNRNPTGIDEQKALASALGQRRCLFVGPDGIDVPRTVALWVFCEQMGSQGLRDGKTAAEVAAEAVQRLPASPYSGETLFRKLRHAKLRTDSDLMVFMVDFFKDVARRVGSGMDRNQKENLLLQLDEIVAALRVV